MPAETGRPPDKPRSQRPQLADWQRWFLGVVALGLLVAGFWATFATDNGIPATAMLVLGALLAYVGVTGQQVTGFKSGDYAVDFGVWDTVEKLYGKAADPAASPQEKDAYLDSAREVLSYATSTRPTSGSVDNRGQQGDRGDGSKAR